MRRRVLRKKTVSELRITRLYAKVFEGHAVSILELPGIWKEAERQINNGADDAHIEFVMRAMLDAIKREEGAK